MRHSSDRPHRLETGVGETALRPLVPVEGVQVDTVQMQVHEHVVQQRGDGVVPVGIAPVVSVSDDYAKLGFLVDAVEIVVHAIADVGAVDGIGAEMVGPGGGVAQLVFKEPQVPLVGHAQGKGGIKPCNLRVAPPAIVVFGVLNAFFTENNLRAVEFNHLRPDLVLTL